MRDCPVLGVTSGTVTFAGGILQYSAANPADCSPRVSAVANQAFAIDTNE